MGVRVNVAAPNGFPANVVTRRLAQAIVELDNGSDIGTIVIVDVATGEIAPRTLASPYR